MNLCIIPARGGSKRIPKKNIKSFCGKPLIAYSIETAINSNLFLLNAPIKISLLQK
jgi:pseudaminic acid cytidylyltransferase